MSLQNNSVHVDQATATMSVGQVEGIKKQAMAQVTVAEQTQREAQTNVAKSSGSAEASVYIAVATEMVASGASTVLNVLGGLDAIRDEKLVSTANGVDDTFAKPIDGDFIQNAASPAGFFKPVDAGLDVFAANSPRAPLKVFDGEKPTAKGAFEDAMLAGDSLKGQPKGATGTWDIPPKKQTAVAEAKQALAMTYDVKMANEEAFNSALVAQRLQAATIYQANQMVPGLGSKMASGPTIRPDTLLSEAKSIQDTAA